MKLRERNNQMRAFQLQQIEEKRMIQANEKKNHLLEAKKMAEQLADEDDVFKEFATKEMQRFKNDGKKTDLLKKSLIT
jgi:hypothetical protein